ncbi:MAG: prolipoprotein diacylglyceryl transferase [Syntrophobacterales bacterium]|jgi:phosphatidylglycerol:prolipoprotein diacylglycerol transferase|nr:prolipoprotein diacylglyceryl transferase [Syntrophobacterales bacterium]
MHPILFKIGPITIYTYGFFLALAFLFAIVVAGREAKRRGLPEAQFYDLCFYLILAALVGSRLLFIILEPGRFLSNPIKIFALWEGGLDFQGGLFLALIVAFFYIRRHGWPWRPTLDSLALGAPLGQFFGRIGCFMAGCCYGTPSQAPWAVTFTNPESLCPLRVPLHPSQLYESFLALGVFGFLFWFRKRQRYSGQMTLLYLFLAGLVRFIVEFFRSPEDYRGPTYFGFMPLTQLLALGLLVVCGSLLIYWGFKSQPQTRD